MVHAVRLLDRHGIARVREVGLGQPGEELHAIFEGGDASHERDVVPAERDR